MPKKKEEKPWLNHVGLTVLYGVLFFFLVANIILSQQFPSLYYSVIYEEKPALVEFFKRGKMLNSFQTLFPEIKSVFSEHEVEIYQEDRSRRELISQLETLLEKNPKSRDILYSLYLLYDREGNESKALEYLKLAQAIDPSVKQ